MCRPTCYVLRVDVRNDGIEIYCLRDRLMQTLVIGAFD
jgi:hypothetical protein